MIVRAATGDLLDQPVTLVRTAPLHLGLHGVVDGVPPSRGVYVVRWRSLVQSAPSGVFGGVVLRDGNDAALIVASLTYNGGGALAYNINSAGSLEKATIPQITWTQGQAQRFELKVDLDAKTTSLSVNGAPVPTLQGVPFDNPAARDITRIRFECGGTSEQVFAWDDVEAVRDVLSEP